MFNIAGWPDTFSVSTEKLGLEGAWNCGSLTGEKEGTIDRMPTAAVETQHGVKLVCLKKKRNLTESSKFPVSIAQKQ